MSIPDDELIWASLAELQTEVKRLRADKAELLALLKRHDDLARKDEAIGLDCNWTAALQALITEARAAITKAESK